MRPLRTAGAGTFIPLVVIAGHVAAAGVFVSHVITIMCNPSLRWSTERNHRILSDNSLTAFEAPANDLYIYTYLNYKKRNSGSGYEQILEHMPFFSLYWREGGLCGGLLWM